MKKFFAVLALQAISVFWGGFALAILWTWFLVPLSVPTITYAHAAGLQLLLLAFMGSRGTSDKPLDLMELAVKTFLLPPIALAMGWPVHWLMLHA